MNAVIKGSFFAFMATLVFSSFAVAAPHHEHIARAAHHLAEAAGRLERHVEGHRGYHHLAHDVRRLQHHAWELNRAARGGEHYSGLKIRFDHLREHFIRVKLDFQRAHETHRHVPVGQSWENVRHAFRELREHFRRD